MMVTSVREKWGAVLGVGRDGERRGARERRRAAEQPPGLLMYMYVYVCISIYIYI